MAPSNLDAKPRDARHDPVRTTIRGRFSIDEGDGVFRLRVREASLATPAWWVSMAVFVASALVARGPVQTAGAVLASWIVVGTGLWQGFQLSARRSIFPRLDRCIELRWTGDAAASPGRHDAVRSNLTASVDGRAFGAGELLGVVIVKSEQHVTSRYANLASTETIRRHAPTLVFQSRLYELASYADADETDARDLADAVASAVTGRSAHAQNFAWTYPRYGVLAGILLHLIVGALVPFFGGLVAIISERPGVAIGAFGIGLVADVFATMLMGELGARERSANVAHILVAARAIFAPIHVDHSAADDDDDLDDEDEAAPAR